MAQLSNEVRSPVNGTSNSLAKCHYEMGQQCLQKYFTIWQIKFASLFIAQSEKKPPKYKYLETIRFQIERMIERKCIHFILSHLVHVWVSDYY